MASSARGARVSVASLRARLPLAGDERLVTAVRRGDSRAFEALYDRHAKELLSFCVFMLDSRHDAEDAVQATFVSAYRALLADRRAIAVRPWLFTIARNECLTSLRKRRTDVELNGELALTDDPVKHAELGEEIGELLQAVRGLPEAQRTALLLAELVGLSQVEIGAVLGVRSSQVKAYVYQARSNLISERLAREAACDEIRRELASARGAALMRGRLRRHLRLCEGCREYADGVARQHRQLGALLPLLPTLTLKYRGLEQLLGLGSADPAACAGGAVVGASAAGTAAEFASGGVKALVAKVAVGVAALGASAGVGMSVLGVPVAPAEKRAPAAAPSAEAALAGVSVSPSSVPQARAEAEPAGEPAGSTSRGEVVAVAVTGEPTAESVVSVDVRGGEADQLAGEGGGLAVTPTAVASPPAPAAGRAPGTPGGGGNGSGGSGAGKRAREAERDRGREQLGRAREERVRRRVARIKSRQEHEPVGTNPSPKSHKERELRRVQRRLKRERRAHPPGAR